MESQHAGSDPELRECFRTCYREAAIPAVAELECRVLGTAYGGSSYTDVTQAGVLAGLLGLGPGLLLLEIGAGAGWPGLALAEQTGCRVVLSDLPFEGLSLARSRAAAADLSDVRYVVAEGGLLPFAPQSFDGVSHSDVLCCLPGKLAVLQASRDVLRAGGRLAFFVIEPGVAAQPPPEGVGPRFVAIPCPYAKLLAKAGFREISHLDVTAQYRETAARWVQEMQDLGPQLRAVLGSESFEQRLTEEEADLDAIDAGFLRRTLYWATT